MIDIGDHFRDIKDHYKELKRLHGIPCPRCEIIQPKRDATIMLPQQTCRVCNYKDPRPRLPNQ